MEEKAMLILLLMFVASQAKNEDLPLCPTDIQYFPQNLPMHCRLPNGADFATLSHLQNGPTAMPPPNPIPQMYQSPPPNKQPPPIPVPFPGAMPGPMGIPLPGPMGMMPVGGPGPAHKLPVIVMPFYTPDASYKKPVVNPRPHMPPKRRRPKKRFYSSDDTDSSDTDTETDTDSSDTDTSGDSTGRDYWKGVKKGWKKNARNSRRSFRRRHKKKDLLTPVLQYVTRDGYVIFEKAITKGEASDWLNVKKKDEEKKSNKNDKDDEEPYESNQPHGDGDEIHDKSRKTIDKGDINVTARPKKHQHRVNRTPVSRPTLDSNKSPK